MKPRLIIFTGKGGVGKTSLAMAYAKYLNEGGKKVKYNSFNLSPDYSLLRTLHIPLFDISVEDSAETYIANKLNSKTIAAFVMATSFFKSLFQMIPGFGNMILLGHILKELEQDPELTIVIDSPASGHALTMFESSNNFKRIFKAGLIVNDIERMKTFLEDEHFLKTYIVSLPNEMAKQEAIELKSELNTIYKNIEIVFNNSLKKFCTDKHIADKDLPNSLKEKLGNESYIENAAIIPFIPESNFEDVIIDMNRYIEVIQ